MHSNGIWELTKQLQHQVARGYSGSLKNENLKAFYKYILSNKEQKSSCRPAHYLAPSQINQPRALHSRGGIEHKISRHMSASAGVIKPENLSSEIHMLIGGQKLVDSLRWRLANVQAMNGYNQVSSFKLITNLFLSGERNEAFLGLFVALLEEQRRRMRGMSTVASPERGTRSCGWDSTTLLMMVHTEMRTCHLPLSRERRYLGIYYSASAPKQDNLTKSYDVVWRLITLQNP
eukprot:scaffold2290_cov122-Skeletonema_marinoi.AAC.7